MCILSTLLSDRTFRSTVTIPRNRRKPSGEHVITQHYWQYGSIMFASGYWRALTAVSPIMRRQFNMRRVLTRTYVYARNIHSRLSISDEPNASGRRLITFMETNDIFGEGSDQFVHAAFRALYRYLELVTFRYLDIKREMKREML